jgi:hypothetical protein
MPGVLFSAVRDVAEGRWQPGRPYEDLANWYDLGSYDYIEVHYHGDLLLDRDVKLILASWTEVLTHPDAEKAFNAFERRFPEVPMIRVP